MDFKKPIRKIKKPIALKKETKTKIRESVNRYTLHQKRMEFLTRLEESKKTGKISKVRHPVVSAKALKTQKKLHERYASKKEELKGHIVKKHHLFLPGLIVVFFIFVGLFLFITGDAQTYGANDLRRVSIQFDGQYLTVPSRVSTVGEFIQKLNIDVSETDTVTPTADTPIFDDSTRIVIQRSREIIIEDGAKRIDVSTSKTDPTEIVRDAGVAMGVDDKLQLSDARDVLDIGLAEQKITIDRANDIKIVVYGEIKTIRTRSDNLNDLFKEMLIVPKAGDNIVPADPKLKLKSGFLYSISTSDKRIESTQESIAFESKSNRDASIEAGKKIVQVAGVPGQKVSVYEVFKTADGAEQKRSLETIVIANPITEVVAVGTKNISTLSISGDKSSWLSAAGVPSDQWASADYVIGRESGWRPGAVNAGGCIGLGQRCGGGKNALAAQCPNWQTDVVCQIQHFSGYANGRYGGWNGAYEFWLSHHWW